MPSYVKKSYSHQIHEDILNNLNYEYDDDDDDDDDDDEIARHKVERISQHQNKYRPLLKTVNHEPIIIPDVKG